MNSRGNNFYLASHQYLLSIITLISSLYPSNSMTGCSISVSHSSVSSTACTRRGMINKMHDVTHTTLNRHGPSARREVNNSYFFFSFLDLLRSSPGNVKLLRPPGLARPHEADANFILVLRMYITSPVACFRKSSSQIRQWVPSRSHGVSSSRARTRSLAHMKVLSSVS